MAIKNNMTKHPSHRLRSGILAIAFVITVVSPCPAQEPPTFELEEPVVIQQDLFTEEAGLAINTEEPEVLFTTIDPENFFGFEDPVTGEIAASILVGAFYNPVTMEPITDVFPIIGNPMGGFESHDLRYNPVSDQYVVVTKADGRGNLGANIPLVAIVNPSSVPAENRIAKAFAYEEDSEQNFDDVAVGVSTNNGNFLLVAERDFPGEGEGVIGALFDQEGNLLTPSFGKLDQIQPAGDEDDPDVDFLANNDVFLFQVNTDGDQYQNRITGSVIQPVPGPDGELQVGEQQILGSAERKPGVHQGHPSAIENPFNDELIGAFDYGNSGDGGDIFYFTVGPALDYVLSEAREQIPYLESSGGDPVNQRHPQLAADPDSGVIVVSYNVNGSTLEVYGMLFTLLGPEGQMLPDNGESVVDDQIIYQMTPDETATISNSANYHNIAYDPHSDSFLTIYATSDNFTKVVRLRITSNHMPASAEDWMVY